MTFHWSETDREIMDAEAPAPIIQRPVVWIERDGAPLLAAHEVLELTKAGRLDAAADRADRLYSGLYRAWREDWRIRPDARAQLEDLITTAMMLSVRAWIAAVKNPGPICEADRASARRLHAITSSTQGPISRLGGRRPGTRQSARDMVKAWPSTPEECAEGARVTRHYPQGCHSLVDVLDHEKRIAAERQERDRREALLADEGLPDDLHERDVDGEKVRYGQFLADTTIRAYSMHPTRRAA